MLKDKYAAERRKVRRAAIGSTKAPQIIYCPMTTPVAALSFLIQAKILNFSIAYGKTAHGLAKDFNTSLSEAEDTVNK